MRIVVHQPNFAPWCGYFAKMTLADIFVFADDFEMPNHSYVNRCRIRSKAGQMWLTIPIGHTTGFPIKEIQFVQSYWMRKHLRTFESLYHRAPFYEEILDLLAPIYEQPGSHLAEFNMRIVRAIAAYLGLTCRFELSSTLHPTGKGDDRIISLTTLLGGGTYISGIGGTKYQDPEKFARAGIRLDVRNYEPIPYRQIHGQFLPGMSILDALFNLGHDASTLLRYTCTESPSLSAP